MKFKITIILLISCLFIFSCLREEEPNEHMGNVNEEISLDSICSGSMPIIPEDFEIDLNDDGIIDFEVIYLLGDIESATASSFYGGHISAIGDNQILRKNSHPILFNLMLNDIQSTVEEPLKWDESFISRFTIVSIDYCINEKWASIWDIWTLDKAPSYLIGLKILNNNLNGIGWIKIEVNDIDGTITILDKGLL